MDENFQMKATIDIRELQRRMEDVEGDVKTMKPILYDTVNSVKNIERSVTKMEEINNRQIAEMVDNGKKIKMYVITAIVGGIISMAFMILQKIVIGG